MPDLQVNPSQSSSPPAWVNWTSGNFPGTNSSGDKSKSNETNGAQEVLEIHSDSSGNASSVHAAKKHKLKCPLAAKQRLQPDNQAIFSEQTRTQRMPSEQVDPSYVPSDGGEHVDVGFSFTTTPRRKKQKQRLDFSLEPFSTETVPSASSPQISPQSITTILEQRAAPTANMITESPGQTGRSATGGSPLEEFRAGAFKAAGPALLDNQSLTDDTPSRLPKSDDPAEILLVWNKLLIEYFAELDKYDGNTTRLEKEQTLNGEDIGLRRTKAAIARQVLCDATLEQENMSRRHQRLEPLMGKIDSLEKDMLSSGPKMQRETIGSSRRAASPQIEVSSISTIKPQFDEEAGLDGEFLWTLLSVIQDTRVKRNGLEDDCRAAKLKLYRIEGIFETFQRTAQEEEKKTSNTRRIGTILEKRKKHVEKLEKEHETLKKKCRIARAETLDVLEKLHPRNPF